MSEDKAIKKEISNMGVPAAIVIAGGLIALAVYFGGQSGNNTQQITAQNNGGVTPVPTALVVGDSGVGEIRDVTTNDLVQGSEDAPVTIIEYSDLECPYCKRFHTTMRQVFADYNGQVRWVFRHFPLDQLHSQARQEAVAVECAAEQNKGWELLDKIYEVTTSNDGLDLSTLPQLAQQVGVGNASQFTTCLTAGEHDDKIVADETDAQVAGGRGTPYSVLILQDGTKIPISGAQPIENVKAIIDAALQS